MTEKDFDRSIVFDSCAPKSHAACPDMASASGEGTSFPCYPANEPRPKSAEELQTRLRHMIRRYMLGEMEDDEVEETCYQLSELVCGDQLCLDCLYWVATEIELTQSALIKNEHLKADIVERLTLAAVSLGQSESSV